MSWESAYGPPCLGERVLQLWPHHSQREISKLTGITTHCVSIFGKRNGLQTISIGKLLEPSKDEWIDAAKIEAAKAMVPLAHVLGGKTYREAVRARWAAWKAVLDANPNYSIAGVGRISGYGHDTILHSLKRMGNVPAKLIRTPGVMGSRASGRLPTYCQSET